MSDKITDLTKNEQIVPKETLPSLKSRSLNFFARPFKARYEKLYRERQHHLVIDALFVVVIILLCVLNFVLVFRKNDLPFANLISNYFHPSQAKLEMNLFVNSKNDTAASLGEKLNNILTLKNNSGAALTNLEVKVKLQGVGIDEKTIVSKGKFVNGNLVWTAEENEALKSLRPGEEISFDFNFQVKEKISLANPTIISQAFVSGFIGGQTFSEQSAENRLKISSDFSVTPTSAYFTPEGDQIGTGEWPPLVGAETSLRVFLPITNTINKVDQIEIVAKLAPEVFLAGQPVVNAGSAMEFNSETNELTWRLASVSTSASAVASFEVKFTPTENNLNQKIKLLDSVQISGLDSFTGAKISHLLGPLMTVEKCH
jgi:hypothetical protein